MYWLLDEQKQREVREIVRQLTTELSTITTNPHTDQLFPYVGRKDRNKAEAIVRHLSPANGSVCDPFTGSGIHAYAITSLSRRLLANEWEPYANRMSSAPWHLPTQENLQEAYQSLIEIIKPQLDYLYWTRCTCGRDHIFYSMFFDREPLKFTNVTNHERLGPHGETINYRRRYQCVCRRTEKFFDQSDADHLAELELIQADPIFNYPLIENSRINLSTGFTLYGSLFPHRSKLALKIIWEGIQGLNCDQSVKIFLEDIFLSILPQAKYKDYRSKSQDLHCPPVMLREVNLLYAFQEQYNLRNLELRSYSFAQETQNGMVNNPISMLDFRVFFSRIDDASVDLVFTDPPWTDGTAYFERAQLYHPWLNYDLKQDRDRLSMEMVVTDAPSRRQVHDIERWWSDLSEFFTECYRVLKPNKFLALFFRPIPASKWLTNLNRIKLVARKAGFEPLLSIDVGSSDPSMRIQQSASYVFSRDVVILFLRLNSEIRRDYFDDHDLDQYAYQIAVELQEEKRGPFLYMEWRQSFSEKLMSENITQLNSPKEERRIRNLFDRYCDDVAPGGVFLPKSLTPFSGQLFDTPAVERLFTYVPFIIDELTREGRTFTYDEFLLSLAEYVENGTRQLISSIQRIDIRAMIETYAEPYGDDLNFRRRPLPQLPEGLTNIISLDPYDFEAFVARLLEAQGFTSIRLLGRSGDRGVDVSGIDPQGRMTVIQCKRYRNNVSADPIQRLHSFAVTRGAQRKILVTTSDFTTQARDEASLTGTELVNGGELEIQIARHLPNYFN